MGNWIRLASLCVQIQMMTKFKTLECRNLIISISTWYIIITDTHIYISLFSPLLSNPINYFVTLVWSPSREQNVLHSFSTLVWFAKELNDKSHTSNGYHEDQFERKQLSSGKKFTTGFQCTLGRSLSTLMYSCL